MTKAGAALLAPVSFLVGGGFVLLLILPLSATPKLPAVKIPTRLLLSPARSALWSPETDNLRSAPIPLLWSHGVRQRWIWWCAAPLLPSVCCSDGVSDVIGSTEQLGTGWLFWAVLFDWCSGVLETMVPTGIARGVGFSPELVPVVYRLCISTGVGSSLCILVVFWATRVGSGWSSVLLLVSTGLLCGFFLWYHVTVNRERLRWSLVLGLFATLKSVVFYGPSGIIIKLLTVLVSGPSTEDSSAYGGHNLRSTLRLYGLVLPLYVTIVTVIVSLTLITY